MEDTPALLSSLAHELRTPLSSLRMIADMLAESPQAALDDSQRRNLGRLRDAAGELTRLAEDLSLFARLQGDRVEACPVAVPLSEWAADLLAGYSPLARQAGTMLRVETGADAAERVVVDRSLFERALGPLLRSAILSSAGSTTAGGEAADGRAAGSEAQREAQREAEGSGVGSDEADVSGVEVTLATSGTTGDGAPGRLRAVVADSGPPLPATGGDALFRPFAADTPRTSGERAGSALGFALARDIARLLGGDVSAADRPGAGGGLVVTLDIALDGTGS